MLSDVRANVSWLFPRGCRMAGIAPAIMSAFKAGSNKKIKSYASYFGLFIRKAKRFPEFLSRVLLMSHWHRGSHEYPSSKGGYKKYEGQDWLTAWGPDISCLKQNHSSVSKE